MSVTLAFAGNRPTGWLLPALGLASAVCFAGSAYFRERALKRQGLELKSEKRTRLRREESLRQREASLRSIFDGVNDAIILHALDGRIIDANSTMLAMYGVSRQEALSLSLMEDYSSSRNDLDDLPRRWSLVRMGVPQFFPWKAKRPLTGEEFDVEVFLSRIALPQAGEAILATIRDVSERRKTEGALLRAESAYRIVFDNAMDAVFQTHVSGRINRANPATANLLGYDSPEDLMVSVSDVARQLYVEPRDRIKLLNLLAKKGAVQNHDLRVRRRDGTIRWMSMSARANFDHYGRMTTIDAVAQDATERKVSEAELLERVNIDELTGLPNRFLFNEHLNSVQRQAKRSGRKFAVMYIDIDGFKEVNDTLGHSKGDALLRQAGKRLRRQLRESDLVARLGGDEFAVLLWDVRDEDAVRRLGEGLLHELAQPFKLNGASKARVSGSIGASIFPFDGNTPNLLVEKADRAMYSAKELGKNSFRLFGERQDHQGIS